MTKAESSPISDEGEFVSDEFSFDPFARYTGFLLLTEQRELAAGLRRFVERLREPIDVRADKILDLKAFGKGIDPFVRAPRIKKREEFEDDLDDRMKHDLERQFILRNIGRYVRIVDEKLEFNHTPVELAQLDFDVRAHVKERHKPPELLNELSTDVVRFDMDWRRTMRDVMEWERYFSREIREDFPGPIWKHDPVTNPVPAKATDEEGAEGNPSEESE